MGEESSRDLCSKVIVGGTKKGRTKEKIGSSIMEACVKKTAGIMDTVENVTSVEKCGQSTVDAARVVPGGGVAVCLGKGGPVQSEQIEKKTRCQLDLNNTGNDQSDDKPCSATFRHNCAEGASEPSVVTRVPECHTDIKNVATIPEIGKETACDKKHFCDTTSVAKHILRVEEAAQGSCAMHSPSSSPSSNKHSGERRVCELPYSSGTEVEDDTCDSVSTKVPPTGGVHTTKTTAQEMTSDICDDTGLQGQSDVDSAEHTKPTDTCGGAASRTMPVATGALHPIDSIKCDSTVSVFVNSEREGGCGSHDMGVGEGRDTVGSPNRSETNTVKPGCTDSPHKRCFSNIDEETDENEKPHKKSRVEKT